MRHESKPALDLKNRFPAGSNRKIRCGNLAAHLAGPAVSVSLKQIRYFIAAAESGQISKAAVDLNVSQSAVTAAVQQLETTLGVRLFDRNP